MDAVPRCPFLAADAARYCDDDEVERIPARWSADDLKWSPGDDLDEWQHLGEPCFTIFETFGAIIGHVDRVERHVDINVHRIIDECVLGFGLSPTYALKASILTKIFPHLDEGYKRCDSPIEKIMLFGLLVTFACYDTGDEWREVDGFLTLGSHRDLGDIILGQQVALGQFRVDFLLGTSGVGSNRGIVIECDGHDFHERTAVQAQRDKSRDRWLQMHGYMVLRFTGREIYQNTAACAGEICEALFSLRRDRA